MNQANSLSAIDAHLRRYRERLTERFDEADAAIAAQLEDIRVAAVAAGDQTLAKQTWCLKTALEMQQQFVAAFRSMQAGEFYDAWCVLERVEIKALNLERHRALNDDYALGFIDRQGERFHKLYPYRVFMSPAFIERDIRCSICGAQMTLRGGCGHRVGEIYDGIQCLRHVEHAELLEMSMVPQPVQKYSVPFMTDPKTGEKIDHYDYGC